MELHEILGLVVFVGIPLALLLFASSGHAARVPTPKPRPEERSSDLPEE